MKYTPNYNSDNGLGLTLSELVSATRKTVENCVGEALILVEGRNYDKALIFLKNAIEGIEILTA